MEQTPVTFSPEAAGLMALMGPPAPISFAPSAVEPMGPTMAELEAGRASESSKISPEVKSAVDTLLGLWGTSNSKGSHQRVLRDFSDAADSVPTDPSSASEADRLKYAMQILEAGQNAKTQFSDKGLNAWKSATSPLMSAYAPAGKFQWISTGDDDNPDYRWTEVAPQLGFKGQIYASVPVERTDEYGFKYQDTETGLSQEFRDFVKQAKAQGYDFVQHADNIVNFNQRYGFRLPSGEILGEYSVRGDQDVRDFGKQLLSMASLALPAIGGPLAASIGSTILPEAAATAIGSAIGASPAAVSSAVGQAALQSGLTALGGGDTGDIIRAGVTGLVSQAVPSVVKDVVPSNLGALEPVVEKAISSAAMSGISGKGDPLESALGSLAGSAVGAVSQGTELPPSVVKGAIELAKTGTLSPNSLINAAIGLSQTADEYQKQKAIEAAYADPSRALDVLQPPSTVRAEMPEDVYGAEGDVFGQDFYTPTEQGTSLDDLIRYIDQEASSGPRPTPENLQPAEDTWMAHSVDEGYFVPPQGPTIEELLAGIGPGIQEGMTPGGLESIGYQPTIDEILASTPPGIQEGMAPGVVAPPTIEEILASIPPGIEEGMVPGGLEREGIPTTPEELQAVDQIISQPSTPSVPVKIPTIPTAPTTPTAPKKTATSQQDIMGLMALMGAMGKKETPQRERNVADVSRGISMSPFGLPYGGRYG